MHLISSGNAVPVCDVEKIPTKTSITIEVKVLSVMEPKLIESKQLNCQEMIVADESGAIRLSVLENEVNSMKQGESYRLENLSVREYVGKKFVSTSTKGSIIKAIPDIGQVDEQTQPRMSADATPGKHLKDVKVVGLQKFDTYAICFKCSSNLKVAVDEDDEEMGECVRCKMIQRISDAEVTGPVTHKSLLKARPFGMQYEDGIIHSIRCS